MAKIYQLEVVKESRALVTVEAENRTEADEIVQAQVKNGEINWTMVDHITTDVVSSREKKG